ncbi:MAG: endopeptidase La [Deltaproteobacteria bacterium]|nr:MAG: endopeptidase La [Deltaproteobacteria bacterium]
MAETDKDDLINILEEEFGNEEIPHTMPMMPVRDVVIFTDMLLPLFVGREKSIKSIEASVSCDNFVFLATQKDPIDENPEQKDIYNVGIIAKVLRILRLPDGKVKALVQGISKARIEEITREKPYYEVKVDLVKDIEIKDVDMEVEALLRNIREQSEQILGIRGELTTDIKAIFESIEDPSKLADLVASNLQLKIPEAQSLLEERDVKARLKKVNDYLMKEVELSTVQAKIQSEVRDEISRTQKDYYLREQVRAIHKELGESDEKAEEIENYKKKIKKAKMPKDVLKEAQKQLRRFEQMNSDSSEAVVIRTYLDWLSELPWSKFSRDMLDIKKASKVLDEKHYGLKKIKERILEYLSVKKLNPSSKSPIICFAGPPGVGKTSLGQAIAKAMNRKFYRVSLGGIRDEAEIRGHRRTYIGALPGRIIQGMKYCGSKNPVFMLDEIDKLGSDFRGDPSSALLEALDPEQNSKFSDHYLNLPFDLSKVMFILTANITDTIPSALFDRMELIELSGYTLEEKEKIAVKYLIPRQRNDSGLKENQLHISNNALKKIIKEYTSEAGVRNLEREISAITRKSARIVLEEKKEKIKINSLNLHKFIGPPKFQPEMDKEKSQVGLSTGLAWTEVGGEVLYIEALILPGKGDIQITGQIGDVMQESARAALSYAKSRLGFFGEDENFFENKDIHLHVPAGAIPKDGPSAGISMATALISAITEKPVKSDVAMTGEITLRGRVLPIGGLKEKALGALRGGIKTVLFPVKNKKDLIEIPANVKKKIKFISVSSIEEVIDIAISEDIFGEKSLEKKKKS